MPTPQGPSPADRDGLHGQWKLWASDSQSQLPGPRSAQATCRIPGDFRLTLE